MTTDGRAPSRRDPGQEAHAIPPTHNQWADRPWLECIEAWLLALKLADQCTGVAREFMEHVALHLYRESNRLYARRWRSM